MSSLGKMYIFVDDERNPVRIPDGMGYCVCRTYKEAIKQLEFYMSHGTKILLALDHDLGCEKTGYDIAKWVVASGYTKLRFNCHSMNPVGRTNITELLTHYGYEMF